MNSQNTNLHSEIKNEESDALLYLMDILESVFMETLKEQCFHEYKQTLEAKIFSDSGFLKDKMQSSIKKKIFMINLSEFMANYQGEMKKSLQSEQSITIRKIVHMAYKISSDRLKNLYCIVKNILNFSKEKDNSNPSTKSNQNQRKSLDTSDIALKEKDNLFLNLTSKPNSQRNSINNNFDLNNSSSFNDNSFLDANKKK